jgi:membrane protease YdiL (CAAX protease family)
MEKIVKNTITGSALTFIYLLLFIYYNAPLPAKEWLITIPAFLLIYFFIFNIGKPEIVEALNNSKQIAGNQVLLFPCIILGIMYYYLLAHGQSPFSGSAALLPFLFAFPVLYYRAFPRTDIGRVDYLVLLVFLIPLTLIDSPGDTTIPVKGNGFGSIFKISWILLMVYVFGHIRKLRDIGFYPIFKIKFLGVAILSWLSFLSFVMLIAYFLGFVNPDPFFEIRRDGFMKSLQELLRIFIGTALFEEVFFRGLLQNILAKQIEKSGEWKTYWRNGFIILLVLSAWAGYALELNLIWFPVAIAIGLFVPAYFLEKKQFQTMGTYTALAIIAMSFGLAHYHKGSIIFVGLAAVAGWAYGYTYLKTKNVFYAALVHTLVNFSEFLFKLHEIK